MEFLKNDSSTLGLDLRLSAFSGGISRHSCVQCRLKKVRCDRIQPCSTCHRNKTECIFQEVRRKRRRHPQPVSPGVLARIEKLEERVEHMSGISFSSRENLVVASDHVTAKRDQTSNAGTTHTGHEASNSDVGTPSPQKAPSDAGRLAAQQERSRYVSSRVWNVLANEVEEMQDILDSSTSEDDSEYASETEDPFQGILFGSTSRCKSLQRFFPPAHKACYLIKAYEENVAPVLPVLHWPTVRDLIMDVVHRGCHADKITKALILAIYYAASASLSADECHRDLGVGQGVLLAKFRFAVQQAIAEADLLSTQSTVLVQAVVLFLTAVRREDDTRFVWSMTSMIVRIGQYLGLHRDGAQLGMTSFDTEMRRRLWWHILLLDMRSSEEHGTDNYISESMYDTRLPSNVDDKDIYPGMTEPVKPQIGFTEMTFCLIRCEVAVALNCVTTVTPSNLSDQSIEQGLEQMVEATNDRIRRKYTDFCDESIPLQRVCVLLSRLVLANLWINLYFRQPLKPHLTLQNISTQSRDKLCHLSLEVIQTSFILERNEHTHRWSWLFHANAHWCYFAFLLSELCVRSPNAFTHEAWGVVDWMQQKWHLMQRHDKKGMLWRPLQRLLQRAITARSHSIAQQQHSDKEPVSPSTLVDTSMEPDRYAELTLPEAQYRVTDPLATSALPDEDVSSLSFIQSDLVDLNTEAYWNPLPAAEIPELDIITSRAGWSFL